MSGSASQRVAVVTAAGRNIGCAIALELAAGGAAVVVNVRSNREQADSVVKEIEKAGGAVLPVLGDVSKEEDVRRGVLPSQRFVADLRAVITGDVHVGADRRRERRGAPPPRPVVPNEPAGRSRVVAPPPPCPSRPATVLRSTPALSSSVAE